MPIAKEEGAGPARSGAREARGRVVCGRTSSSTPCRTNERSPLVLVTESVERELVESYRKVILTALGEVESALVGASRVAQQETLQADVLTKSQNALRLAEVRYREGADDLMTVLDAQRSLFDAQDRLAQIRLQRLQGAVDLFKALGGGWNAADTQLVAAKS